MDTAEAEHAHTPIPKPGGKRPLSSTPGTYIPNKEHEIYNLASPAIAQESKTTKVDHPQSLPNAGEPTHFPQPTTPSHATAPPTLADIAHLLQTQLQTQLAPITKEISEVKSSMQPTMQNGKDELKQQIDELDERITQLEITKNSTQGRSHPHPPTDLMDKIEVIEAKLEHLQKANLPNQPRTNTPAIIGGLSSLGNFDSAKPQSNGSTTQCGSFG